MRIAVVGSGIAGLASAWLLAREHAVTLFEAGDYLGGHTHTHDIELRGRRYAVDSGFIVYNPRHYPLLTRLFDELGVASQPTHMSFSVRNEASGLEYNTTTIGSLFCQRRNLLSPRFLGMIGDILRFGRATERLAERADLQQSLGDYLREQRYGSAFRDDYLVPMASALWSAPAHNILSFPVSGFVRFMANHQMLRVYRRAPWRVVRGGSANYVRALRARWTVEERLRCPVHAVRRRPGGIEVQSAAGDERFDQLVLACHSDQALAVLRDASEREQEVLGAITYQANDAILHTDAALLPRHPRARAAWNAFVPRKGSECCTVSYCMNLLQNIDCPEPLIVTLNRTAAINPRHILRRMRYEHPVYTERSVAARARKAQIQGRRGTWFAGAYWGWGFHEDGMRSAVEVAAALGVRWPASLPGAAPLPELAPLLDPARAAA